MREEQVKKSLKLTGVAFLLLFCLLPVMWVVVGSLVKEPDFLLPPVAFDVTVRANTLSYSQINCKGDIRPLARRTDEQPRGPYQKKK